VEVLDVTADTAKGYKLLVEVNHSVAQGIYVILSMK